MRTIYFNKQLGCKYFIFEPTKMPGHFYIYVRDVYMDVLEMPYSWSNAHNTGWRSYEKAQAALDEAYKSGRLGSHKNVIPEEVDEDVYFALGH